MKNKRKQIVSLKKYGASLIIIKAVIEKPRTWRELEKLTNWRSEELKRSLDKLIEVGAVVYRDKKYYHADEDSMKDKYVAFKVNSFVKKFVKEKKTDEMFYLTSGDITDLDNFRVLSVVLYGVEKKKISKEVSKQLESQIYKLLETKMKIDKITSKNKLNSPMIVILPLDKKGIKHLKKKSSS